MKISDIMTRDVRLTTPETSIQQAAMTMDEIDAGFIPVSDNDRLVGTITDRDIAVRAVAKGLGPDTKVSEVMTRDVKYCFEGDEVADVARNMGDIQVRRLPVVSADKQLVGVVSLGDIAIESDHDGDAETALSGISEPSRVSH